MSGLPGGCNPADVLFKLAHGRGLKPPVFGQVSEHGPPHSRTFTWSCSFFEDQYKSTGSGRSKKEAKNAAAKNLITQLDLSKLPEKPQPQNPHKRKMIDTAVAGIRDNSAHSGGVMGGDMMMGPQLMMVNMNMGMDMNMSKNKRRKMIRGGMMGPMMGHGFGNMFMGPGGGGYGTRPVSRTFEDRHVMDKHMSIYPEESELYNILQSVNHVEHALKNISDKFHEDESDGERSVTGVARVGDLAKTLMLRGDRKVELVVMCSKKPTKQLLENIVHSLQSELSIKNEQVEKDPADEESEADTTEMSFVVKMDESSSGLIVESCHCIVRVTLTSTLLRSADDENNHTKQEDTEDEVKTEADSDLLSHDHGLRALAELRRAKWFTAMASPLPSCVEATRIMKEKTRRDTVWSALDSWALELLVERSLFSVGFALSPSKSIMRVMEVVAGGLLLPGGPGIRDPCEREDVDVFDHLTAQSREDITRQAQADLRNIHYRKIHLVLGVEPFKRPGHSKTINASDGQAAHNQISETMEAKNDVMQENKVEK